jgi:hypothetical protein
MSEKGKEGGGQQGGRGQYEQGHPQPGGPRSDVNDELLSVFRELVSRVGQAPQGRGLSPEAAAVVQRFTEFENTFNLVDRKAAVEEFLKQHKQRQQKGA